VLKIFKFVGYSGMVSHPPYPPEDVRDRLFEGGQIAFAAIRPLLSLYKLGCFKFGKLFFQSLSDGNGLVYREFLVDVALVFEN